MMICLHFRFHLSFPVCLDPSFCYYSSGCINAILVLLVVFVPEFCLSLKSTGTVGNDESVIKERRKIKINHNNKSTHK